jgi:hypothetical protein
VIELAYRIAEACGIPLWTQDEAGPYATRQEPGESWRPEGRPKLQPHEYLRDGGAKLMTLFRPATGSVRAKGVVSVTNAILHRLYQRATARGALGRGADQGRSRGGCTLAQARRVGRSSPMGNLGGLAAE